MLLISRRHTDLHDGGARGWNIQTGVKEERGAGKSGAAGLPEWPTKFPCISPPYCPDRWLVSMAADEDKVVAFPFFFPTLAGQCHVKAAGTVSAGTRWMGTELTKSWKTMLLVLNPFKSRSTSVRGARQWPRRPGQTTACARRCSGSRKVVHFRSCFACWT